MIQRAWKIRLDSATGEREHARRLENTSVALVKYEDYACLYCGRASPDGAGDAQIHSVSGGGAVIRAGRGMPPSCGSARRRHRALRPRQRWDTGDVDKQVAAGTVTGSLPAPKRWPTASCC